MEVDEDNVSTGTDEKKPSLSAGRFIKVLLWLTGFESARHMRAP